MNKKSFWFWAGLWLLNVLAMAYGWMYPVKLTVAFGLEILVIWVWDRRKRDEVWLGVTILMGPLVDLISVRGGAWSYGAPFIAGIPLWLPLAYGISGLLLRRLTDEWGRKK